MLWEIQGMAFYLYLSQTNIQPAPREVAAHHHLEGGSAASWFTTWWWGGCAERWFGTAALLASPCGGSGGGQARPSRLPVEGGCDVRSEVVGMAIPVLLSVMVVLLLAQEYSQEVNLN